MNERIWQPSASLDALRFRAEKLAQIRQFFSARQVLEVETPQLAAHAASDPHIESYAVGKAEAWLQSSPEYHMKRLLAAGSGCIYQIGKAYRVDEAGRWHNPEFTMLEWYRLGFDHLALMDELAELWGLLSGQDASQLRRYSYADLFYEYLQVDVHQADAAVLKTALAAQTDVPAGLDHDALCDLAMGLVIGPKLGQQLPVFVYDYPASQAALARLGADGHASRFEMYWQGVELANGFHELSDASEQARRFAEDAAVRQSNGQHVHDADQRLLAALDAGLPDCAGVALGLDRLCSLLYGVDDVRKTMSFSWERA